MPKRGLPTSVKMRHDSHYIEELASPNKTIGKVIKIERIFPNPDQPRVEFGDLTELTSSIEEQGVLEPLLVKPNRETGKYMIIAGERRWRASTLAGLTEVPCIELNIDENAIAEIALVENLQRKDLTIWEISDGLADLNERYGYTHDEIAKKIGKSRTTVTESMAIAGLPNGIRERCIKAKINSKSTLIEISRQFDEDGMDDLIDQISSKGLNRKQIRKKTPTNKPKALINNSSKHISAVNEKSNSISFKYDGIRNDFTINLEFKSEDFDNKDILKALKEAFDSVKNG